MFFFLLISSFLSFNRLFHLPFTVVVAHGSHRRLEVGCCLLLNLVSQGVDFEAIQSGNKLVCRAFRSVFGMNHEEHVGKSCAEVGAVSVVVAA